MIKYTHCLYFRPPRTPERKSPSSPKQRFINAAKNLANFMRPSSPQSSEARQSPPQSSEDLFFSEKIYLNTEEMQKNSQALDDSDESDLEPASSNSEAASQDLEPNSQLDMFDDTNEKKQLSPPPKIGYPEVSFNLHLIIEFYKS